MYMYLYIYIRINTYVDIYCKYINLCIYIYVIIYVYVYVCRWICKCICICICIWFHLLSIETSGTLRGAIPEAENLHFATISRDRPTESCERVHPAEWKCASRYSGVHAKIWKCKFRYSGVRKMYEVWGGTIPWGGLGSGIRTHIYIYIHI